MYKVKVLDNRQIASGVFLTRLEKPFLFVAGQVIGVKLKESDAPRLYSIVSGENKKYLEILYDIKNGGYLTPVMSRAKIGDELLISEPQGDFICRSDDVFWIATGTGVAPFVSMLKSGKEGSIVLLHGARKEENLYFNNFLKENLRENYIPCLSRSHESIFYKGKVTDWLMENNFSKKKIFFLCGRAEMVVDVRDILLERGVGFENIISEIYF